MDDHPHSSLLPFGDHPEASTLSPALQQCAMNLYRQAWADYRDVDCPFGETDKAMLVWYTFRKEGDRPPLVTGKN